MKLTFRDWHGPIVVFVVSSVIGCIIGKYFY